MFCRLPFEQNTLHGYVVGSFFQLIAVWKFVVVFCVINTFFIGICLYVRVFFKDIEDVFRNIDSIVGDKVNMKLHSRQMNEQVKAKLVDINRFHVKIKRFSSQLQYNFLFLRDLLSYLTQDCWENFINDERNCVHNI